MSSRNSGEADRIYWLFTKDLGIVVAKATGIRKIESRLHFFVQDFKYIEASLVKGKTFWRLISAQPVHELNSKKSLSMSSRIRSLQLIQRLAPEGEPLEDLFGELVDAYTFTSTTHPKISDMQSIEALLTLKILHNLGYWGDKQSDLKFITSPFSKEAISEISSVKSSIIKELNNSLRATQLV
jgi:recombinational DNA repair protein (RecF pathway)